MLELNSAPLMTVKADVADAIQVGQTPIGTRLIANVTGGVVEGERVRGEVLATGADWLLVRGDGSFAIDVRAAIKTHDGAVIYMTYQGRWTFTPDVGARLFDPAQSASVDPSEYYFRTAPFFETGDDRYAWLNGIVAIGVGRRTATGVEYAVHEIK